MKKSKIDEVNTNVSMLAEFVRIRGNPFQCQQGDEKLKNFVTQIEAEKEVAKVRCSFLSDTQEEYAEFRKAAYVDKSRLLSDKITMFNLKPIDYIDTQASDQELTKVAKKSEKLSRLAMKILMIAKDKADELEYVLQHDITSYNYLFNGSTMTKTSKSQLISLLKAYLIQEDYKFKQVSHNVSVFVDFMSYLRSQLVSNLPGATFGTVLTYILSALIRKHPSKVTHVIFNSYLEQSLKEMDREKRGKHGVIYLAKIEYNTPIPQQTSKFWASDKKQSAATKVHYGCPFRSRKEFRDHSCCKWSG